MPFFHACSRFTPHQVQQCNCSAIAGGTRLGSSAQNARTLLTCSTYRYKVQTSKLKGGIGVRTELLFHNGTDAKTVHTWTRLEENMARLGCTRRSALVRNTPSFDRVFLPQHAHTTLSRALEHSKGHRWSHRVWYTSRSALPQISGGFRRCSRRSSL